MKQRHALLSLILLTSVVVAQEEPAIGMSKSKPAGRSVKTPQGYMTPYKQRIPGTKVEFEMVPVPGGRFVLGSPKSEPGRRADEGPQVPVEVEPFWMGKFEVTWAEYRVYMECFRIFAVREKDRRRELTLEERIDAVTAPTPLYEPDIVFQYGEADNEPAAMMTHYAARQYSKWLSLMTQTTYRLPTEIEWEHAARAGSKTAFFFGDDASQLGKYAWFVENSNEQYQPVGQKRPNPWGLYDIYGNVAELTLSTYSADGHANVKPGLQTVGRIEWPAAPYNEVVRGGSWDSSVKELRSASRAKTKLDWCEADPMLPRSSWWFTEEAAAGCGIRLIRPLAKVDRESLETHWDGGAQAADAKKQERNGRSIAGVVNKSLARELLRTRGIREIRKRREQKK